METEKLKEIERRAVETYGPLNQKIKLFEELSELQNAICKERWGRDTVDHIAEEIADVLILFNQMLIIYDIDPETVNDYFRSKLLRLEDRMDELQKGSD